MIDWLTFELPYPHAPLQTDLIMRVSPDGVSQWVTKCHLPVSGSYDSSVLCTSVGAHSDGLASHLRISGNPAKFLQGHNVFGTDDILLLINKFLLVLFPILGFEFTPFVSSAVPRSKLYRIDINYGYLLPCRSDVINWLRAAEFKSRSRSGRPCSSGSTLYFQKNSRRWAFKFYSKGQELDSHPISDKLPSALIDKIYSYSQRLLRAELTLRRMELVKICCSTVADFINSFDCPELFGVYMDRIELRGQNSFLSENLFSLLPNSVRSTYVLWREGHNPFSMLSRATFYRHRKILLEYEIDISIPLAGGGDSSGYIQLIKPLIAKPESIPDWVYDSNLIVC